MVIFLIINFQMDGGGVVKYSLNQMRFSVPGDAPATDSGSNLVDRKLKEMMVDKLKGFYTEEKKEAK